MRWWHSVFHCCFVHVPCQTLTRKRRSISAWRCDHHFFYIEALIGGDSDILPDFKIHDLCRGGRTRRIVNCDQKVNYEGDVYILSDSLSGLPSFDLPIRPPVRLTISGLTHVWLRKNSLFHDMFCRCHATDALHYYIKLRSGTHNLIRKCFVLRVSPRHLNEQRNASLTMSFMKDLKDISKALRKTSNLTLTDNKHFHKM